MEAVISKGKYQLEAERKLREYGISSELKGFQALAYMVALAAEDPEQLWDMTDDLHPEAE